MGFAWIGIACASCAALCGLLLVAPVRVELEYRRSGVDEVRAHVRALYGIVRIHWSWPNEDERWSQGDEGKRTGNPMPLVSKHPINPSSRSFRAWRAFARRALAALDRMAPHVHVDELRFEARMGAGESVRTGMLVGVSYAAIYTLLGWLSSRVQMHRVPTVSISPAFQDALLSIYAKSIVRIRTGYVIAAGLRLLTAWKRRAS